MTSNKGNIPESLYSDTLKIFSQPRQAHLFSIQRFYSLWDDFKKGRRSPSSMNKACSKGLSTKTIKARAWFQEFVRTSGDSMPHEDKVCLPACLTKRDIYKMYAQDWNVRGTLPQCLGEVLLSCNNSKGMDDRQWQFRFLLPR